MTLPPQIPDPRHPDMSPEAIDRRLQHLSQLYRLGMARAGECIGSVGITMSGWLGAVTAAT